MKFDKWEEWVLQHTKDPQTIFSHKKAPGLTYKEGETVNLSKSFIFAIDIVNEEKAKQGYRHIETHLVPFLAKCTRENKFKPPVPFDESTIPGLFDHVLGTNIKSEVRRLKRKRKKTKVEFPNHVHRLALDRVKMPSFSFEEVREALNVPKIPTYNFTQKEKAEYLQLHDLTHNHCGYMAHETKVGRYYFIMRHKKYYDKIFEKVVKMERVTRYTISLDEKNFAEKFDDTYSKVDRVDSTGQKDNQEEIKQSEKVNSGDTNTESVLDVTFGKYLPEKASVEV